jgi:chemotaxis protein MotB
VDYWPGFLDVTLSVVLVLLFLVTLFVVTQTGLVKSLSSKESVVANLQAQLARLQKELGLSQAEAIKLRGEAGTTATKLSAAAAELLKVQGEVSTTKEAATTSAAASAQQIADLTKRINEYLEQIKKLNDQIGASQVELTSKTASLATLNASTLTLSEEIKRLTARLGETEKEATDQKLKLGQLAAALDKSNAEIDRLKIFEKYRSEFLAALSAVFEGEPDIRVVGDRFVFQGEVLFASGSADLTEPGKLILNKFVETYKKLESRIPRDVGLNIQIQGHTDNDPIVTAAFPSNWELSTARAVRVLRYLSLQGLPQNVLSAAGYGEFYPAVKNDTPAAKRQNRRIEILFTRR